MVRCCRTYKPVSDCTQCSSCFATAAVLMYAFYLCHRKIQRMSGHQWLTLTQNGKGFAFQLTTTQRSTQVCNTSWAEYMIGFICKEKHQKLRGPQWDAAPISFFFVLHSSYNVALPLEEHEDSLCRLACNKT